MRIGVDATCWANERGYGRFTRELLSAMVVRAPAHHFICFLDERAAARFTVSSDNVTRIVVPQSVSPTVAARSGGRRSLIDLFRLTNAVRAAAPDIFFSPAVYGYFPLPPGLPAVVTFHDAIAERFPLLTLPSWRDRLFWRMKVKLALRQSDLVLTVSDYAARQVALYLGVPPAKLRVSLEGVAEIFSPTESQDEIRAAAARAGIPDGARWLIYVGGFGPHKHVDLLVRAHAAVARRHASPPLVLLLVGNHGEPGGRDVSPADGFFEHTDEIRQTIRECGTETLVRWPGYVPDAELRHLHGGAVALVLASASEGFGLPAVEAARCATPVIATTESPLPQLLEGGGLFIPPGDAGAIERAIDELLTDEESRRAMGRRAHEMSHRLSWSRSADVVISALEEVG